MCIRDRGRIEAIAEQLSSLKEVRYVALSTGNYDPVSYTHLDVYKRQARGCALWRPTSPHVLGKSI